MRINHVIQNVLNYSRENPAVSIPVAIVLLFIFYRKPKLIYVLGVTIVVAAGIMEIFRMLESIGLGK